MTTIAFLGLGRMGTPMAGRVLAAGHDLIVWNRTAGRTGPLVDEGARAARTPAEAAREAEIVITMLADPAALEAVALGPDGVAGAIAPTACLVEMSTVGPETALAVKARLPAGTGFVDAPVMGSVGPARSGELMVLAGGTSTGWRRCSPSSAGSSAAGRPAPVRRASSCSSAPRWPGSRSSARCSRWPRRSGCRAKRRSKGWRPARWRAPSAAFRAPAATSSSRWRPRT